ncbi:hypothetical protein ABEF91_007392 [Exophiala dermatitidis]
MSGAHQNGESERGETGTKHNSVHKNGWQLVEDERVYTKRTADRGNGLFAVDDIAAKSQLLFVARPLLVALENAKLPTNCYYCFREPGGQGLWQMTERKEDSLKTCSRCKVAKFCDQKCQTEAWSQYHRLECKLFSRLYPRVLPSTVRAVIRLLKQHKAGILPPGEWEQLLALQSHQQDLANAGGQRWQDLLIMSQGIKGYSGTDEDDDLILRLSCAVIVNSFTLSNATFDSIGVILHPKPALLNHSCDPNAYVRFDVSETDTLGSISVHALRDIAKDEEITISYIDTTVPCKRRQQQLSERYFFTCQCHLCANPDDTPQDGYYWPALGTSASSASPSISILRQKGDEAETILHRVREHPGCEYEYLGEIRAAMKQLAQTAAWPLHRYPWLPLRQRLQYGLLGAGRFPEAMLQAAVFVRFINPIHFKQEYHPLRLTGMWTFWIIARHCLEESMSQDKPSNQGGHDIRALGLLTCVVIDHIHQIAEGMPRPRGQLERIIDQAFQEVQQEGGFWAEYWSNRPAGRKAAWSWLDDQIRALLKAEGVSQEIISSL